MGIATKMGTNTELVNTRNNTVAITVTNKRNIKIGRSTYANIPTELQKDVKNFKISSLRYFTKNWYNGCNGYNGWSTYPLCDEENEIISVEIKTLLKKLVIAFSIPDEGELISDILMRGKKDGNIRMILNLKTFNKFVNYKHFKMESINNVINLIKPNIYMASIDLKDASFSVRIHNDHKKYLKFIFGNFLKFTSMPDGYGTVARYLLKYQKCLSQMSNLRN